MPTVEVSLSDLEGLIGRPLPHDQEQLNEILAYVKGEVGSLQDDELTIEVKDSNHPDIWSVEGIARALRGFLGIESGLKAYRNRGASGVQAYVDKRLREIRPYIACSVIRGVNLSDTAIKSMMHLQDKLDLTYGRGRKRTSIGLYELDLVKPPIHYTVSQPEETSFTPLGFDTRLTLKEILVQHPKGVEYGHIVDSFPAWPILKDDRGNVLSFPPIINSNDLGRITPATKNILIEITGTAKDAVLDALTIITLALADRAGEIYSTRVVNPLDPEKTLTTPKLGTLTVKLDLQYVTQMLGLALPSKDLRKLLERARYRVVKFTKRSIVVGVPCYRKDVMHPIDVIEDIAIAYDVNKVPTRWPPFQTVGGLKPETEYYDRVRELSVGFGFQEILTFNMTTPHRLYAMMNLPPQPVIEVANPKMATQTCIRTWLIPSLLELLSNNTHHDYPQKIFEVGDCALPSEDAQKGLEEAKRLAYVTAHPTANFTEMKSILESLMTNLGLSSTILDIEHASFIQGRVGALAVKGEDVGLIGEIHPEVLEAWKLEMPATALELDLTKLRRHLRSKG